MYKISLNHPLGNCAASVSDASVSDASVLHVHIVIIVNFITMHTHISVFHTFHVHTHISVLSHSIAY